MLIRLLWAAVPAVLACAFGSQLAHADIYTWVDASGGINVSNLAPPDGVRVTNVIHASEPKITTREDTRQVEMQALAERVRLLEDELELARRQAPPPVEYRAFPAPRPMQYPVDPEPPPLQYSVAAAQPMNSGCDLGWTDCGFWWGSSIYPASVVVLRAPGFRRFNPIHGGRHVVAQHPMRAPGDFRRREQLSGRR
jgi:hypothetical protein